MGIVGEPDSVGENYRQRGRWKYGSDASVDRFKRYYDSDVVEVIIVWERSPWEDIEIAYFPL